MGQITFDWVKVLDSEMNFEVMTKVVPTKGHLVYEYNPLRNYRLTKSRFEFNSSVYTEEELQSKFGVTINKTDDGKEEWIGLEQGQSDPVLIGEPGELVDFITDELNISLEHPIHIIPQASYDGSVNLIINDGLNIPRLINTRFSATGKNTYEVIDRKGNNDTNIYDQGTQFDIDTSLYKQIVNIPKIDFRGTEHGGNLKVGNYHFYFKLADADGNETDFVGESGLVSIFIGFDGPNSVHTGTKNENSLKSVNFQITNIDSAYDNVYVYYSRSTAELGDNFVTEYIKIDKKFKVNNSGICNILINGFEETTQITASDINTNYNVVSNAYTSAVCQNMLFLGNVEKPHIPYKELSDLSLRFLPFLKETNYALDMTEDYVVQSSSLGYYDSKFIYNNVGYWDKEIYRLGIVYIMPNNELSPVFNIRGADKIKEYSENQFTNIPLTKDDKRIYINYNDETYHILAGEGYDLSGNSRENVKGVIRFEADKDNNTIHGIDIRVSTEVINELKKYVKGYFFVRQTRIPTILAQGITIGIDDVSRTPTIPTKGGIVDQLKELDLDKTYVETDGIDGVHYISEGFLSRYNFGLKAKHGFLNVLSTVLSYAATAVSFLGPVGQIASIGLNAASFVTSTIATGKFQTAAFVSTLASGVAFGAGKIASIVSKDPSKLTAFEKLLTKVPSNTYTDIGKIAKSTTKIASSIQTAAQSYRQAEQIIGAVSGKNYRGRYTDIPTGYERKESSDSRTLNGEFIDRFIIKDPKYNKIQAIICPDYEVNQAYYNQLFTGNSHLLRYTKSQGVNFYNQQTEQSTSNYFSSIDRHFYMNSYYDTNTSSQYYTNIIGVPDNVKCVGINDLIFRSRAGEAEEAWRYEYVGKEYDDSEDQVNNSDIIRGSFGPYLACDSERLDPATIVDIMIPGYSEANMDSYFKIRMDDDSVFNAISDRIDIHKDQDDYLVNDKNSIGIDKYTDGYKYELYRGDCYLCQFTHRVNRNFNDPSAPYNDQIVDSKSWKDNYDPDNTEKYEQINLGDVNAVPLGMWVTFKLRSSNNLNIRTLDPSNVDETAMTGHERGYFPYQPMSTEGTYKTPESQIYNKGFGKSVSERWNFEIPDVPHIKNWFGTRIMYSDIHVNDAYKNGFRVFQGTHYRDYTREYGEIIKLVPFESSLLCVFEHGIALIPVNERAVAGQGSGGNVYINTSNVLPENPKIISDMFGSQWPESILKVPGKTGDAPQYVYGVDTVAKKIWRTDGTSIQCISDFKVQEFLNNNITLGERELTPKIGIRNVKTHYNAFKRDVMFTFYDNTYGFEEKVWNLCWNELLQKFITFYSWVPSYMENINNIPFSFNRDTSKWIAKLGTSHTSSSFADGITLTNVITKNESGNDNLIVDNYTFDIKYLTKSGELVTKTYEITEDSRQKFIGVLSLDNRVLPESQAFYTIQYQLQRDSYLNYKKFTIKTVKVKNEKNEDGIQLPQDAKYAGKIVPVYALYFNTVDDEFTDIYYKEGDSFNEVIYLNKEDNEWYTVSTYNSIYNVESLLAELYYRNSAGKAYPDYENHKISYKQYSSVTDVLNLPIYKDITGSRPMLPENEQLNSDKLVTLLSIKAIISIEDEDNPSIEDAYYKMKANYNSNTSLISAGYYESIIAITPKWNLQFLSTDFWKHGQAGLIDIADEIKPTNWYGRQHPFEFECVVVNDPSTHKIFQNLELVANKAKPESFHYEIIGESYDFAKDKVNMYFRQEALKALWQYNGEDICYNRNFLKVQPRQQAKSADFPHKYYTRQDKINEIEDYYVGIMQEEGHDYRHLSGAEIVYYPNRQEYRIWNHTRAISLDDLSQNDSRSIITANCQYLEDRWKVTINPILVCYKNEYKADLAGGYLIQPKNTTWAKSTSGQYLPPLTIYNSPIPDVVKAKGEIEFPDTSVGIGKDSALYNLYDLTDFKNGNSDKPLDTTNWLNDVGVYKTNFGEAQNRKELDLKDKFMKVRIRYSGEELAVIDFLNTVYRISYA